MTYSASFFVTSLNFQFLNNVLGLHIIKGFFFFFPSQNNYKSQTILLVSQGFETILVSNKSSAENLILLCEIALGN